MTLNVDPTSRYAISSQSAAHYTVVGLFPIAAIHSNVVACQSPWPCADHRIPKPGSRRSGKSQWIHLCTLGARKLNEPSTSSDCYYYCSPVITPQTDPRSQKPAARGNRQLPLQINCVQMLALYTNKLFPQTFSIPISSSDQHIHQPDSCHKTFHHLLVHAYTVRDHIKWPLIRGPTRVGRPLSTLQSDSFVLPPFSS